MYIMDNTERCKKLVATIQQLESTEIEELFKLLHANGCHYTSNNHGVFLNLSWLTEEILQKIETYVAFCVRSRHEVQKYESICHVLNRNIQEHPKTTKPVPNTVATSMGMVASESSSDEPKKSSVSSKVSSSMKFYLLKKRFAKQSASVVTTKNDLFVDSI